MLTAIRSVHSFEVWGSVRGYTYADRQRLATIDEETLRQYVGVHSPGGYSVDTGAGMYFPTMLSTAGPERMRHLRQCGRRGGPAGELAGASSAGLAAELDESPAAPGVQLWHVAGLCRASPGCPAGF